MFPCKQELKKYYPYNLLYERTWTCLLNPYRLSLIYKISCFREHLPESHTSQNKNTYILYSNILANTHVRAWLLLWGIQFLLTLPRKSAPPPEGVMSKLSGALCPASWQSAWNEANVMSVLSCLNTWIRAKWGKIGGS